MPAGEGCANRAGQEAAQGQTAPAAGAHPPRSTNSPGAGGRGPGPGAFHGPGSSARSWGDDRPRLLPSRPGAHCGGGAEGGFDYPAPAGHTRGSAAGLARAPSRAGLSWRQAAKGTRAGRRAGSGARPVPGEPLWPRGFARKLPPRPRFWAGSGDVGRRGCCSPLLPVGSSGRAGFAPRAAKPMPGGGSGAGEGDKEGILFSRAASLKMRISVTPPQTRTARAWPRAEGSSCPTPLQPSVFRQRDLLGSCRTPQRPRAQPGAGSRVSYGTEAPLQRATRRAACAGCCQGPGRGGGFALGRRLEAAGGASPAARAAPSTRLRAGQGSGDPGARAPPLPLTARVSPGPHPLCFPGAL